MEKGWLNNKNFLRIFSLVAAFILWFYVVTNEDPPRSERVHDVEIICGLNQTQLNDGMVVFSKSSDALSFTAHGKRSLVTGVRGAYYAKLNLDGIAEPGKYTVTPDISKPDGVEIKDIEPSVVEVYVDKYVTSLVPVKVVQKGQLGGGLVVAGIEPAQKQISVTMPSLALEEVAYAGLAIDMSNITVGGTETCRVEFYTSSDEIIKNPNMITDHDDIAVTIELEKHKTVKITPDVRINGKIPEDSEMKISPQSIDVYGDTATVDALESISTQPLVFDAPPQIGEEYETKVILPEGVHLKEGVSNSVTFSLQNKNQ